MADTESVTTDEGKKTQRIRKKPERLEVGKKHQLISERVAKNKKKKINKEKKRSRGWRRKMKRNIKLKSSTLL